MVTANVQSSAGRSIRRVSEKVELTCKRVQEWKEAHASIQEVLAARGFPVLHGTPSGYLLDDPAIDREASAHADSVRKRECQKQKRDVPVEFLVHHDPSGKVYVELFWSQIIQ